MLTDTIHAATNTLRYATAVLRMQRAAAALLDALKQEGHWRYQPRIPPGLTGGGQWTDDPRFASDMRIEPVYTDIGPGAVPMVLPAGAVAGFFAAIEKARPIFARVPKLWGLSDRFPTQDEFDPETGRIGPPTARRPEIPFMMFSSYRELKKYLGPAGPDRVWHHIVEQRLTGKQFPAGIIHNTDNVVNVPTSINLWIAGQMKARSGPPGSPSVRYEVEQMSFEDQYNLGIRLLEAGYRLKGLSPDE